MRRSLILPVAKAPVLVALALFMISCGEPGNSAALSDAVVQGPAGTIRLSLPAELFRDSQQPTDAGTIGITAVDTPAAQADASIIEVLVVSERPAGEPGTENAIAVGDEPVIAAAVTVSVAETAQAMTTANPVPLDISVAPGTYRILVLAGTQSGTTSCLLASGYTDTPIVVAENTATSVAINLTTISHSVTVPSAVYAGSTYTITAAGDTNNAVLLTESVGTTDTYRFQGRFDSESSMGVIPTSFAGTAWTLSHTTVAPASELDENWYSAWLLSGPYITYKDPNTGAWVVLDGSFSRRWRWLSSTVLGTGHHLWEEVAVPVSLQPSTTGVTVQLTWS